MSTNSIPSTSPSLVKLITELNKLPGVGPKSAQRLAFHLIRLPEADAYALANAITSVKKSVVFCQECQNLTDSSPCAICADSQRDAEVVCVVEDPLDVLALERTRCFRGLYHVLHGAISPLNGVGPDQLKIKELMVRLAEERIQELVIATNPTLEGEATAMYIRRNLDRGGLKVTHLARGLPVGGSIEYSDDLTLSRAFQGRQEM